MSPNQRRPLVGGNWKMHFVRDDAQRFCGTLLAGGVLPADVVIFPSFTLLQTVADALADSEVGCGGQDIHPEERGAHTGDVSGPQLVDTGCSWVLCGHSERR
ncbi:MAG: triose-phosphate isomerase, partial [Thermoanaerobaculia bacterium]